MVRRNRSVASCFTLTALVALTACGDPEVIDVPGRGDQTDRFEQRKASAIDILFVIDNSGSMRRHQLNLSENFEHFFRLIDPDPGRVGEAGEVDYRLAVATTDAIDDAGKIYHGPGEPAVLRPSKDYDPLELFRSRALVGTEGASREEGFRAAELAVETAAGIGGGGGERSFLRDKAYLYLIFVSDEDDESRDEVRYFERRFRSLKGKGDEKTVIVSAIAGPNLSPLPDECLDDKGDPTVRPGARYEEMAALTGGTIGNICQADWAQTLEELAYTGLGLRKRFQLTAPLYAGEDKDNPDVDILFRSLKSIEVQYPCSIPRDDPKLSEEICFRVEDRCDGGDGVVACAPYYDLSHRNGFWFEPRDNTIVFAGDAVPGPGSVIEVRYTPRDK